MDATEQELLNGLREGSAASFEQIFRAHYARLCNFALSYLHSRADAEETVQVVFLNLWARREELVVRTHLRAYLFAATRNQALNRSARARLEQRWYEQAELDPDDTAAFESGADLAEAAQLDLRVRAAVERLPPGCRRILQLRWESGLSYAEIADAVGISVKGVENQLGRARKALRAQLGDLID